MKETMSKKLTYKDEKSLRPNFPIIAIGSSAGGLEAMTELLTNLSPDTGMAFIYVQHLSADHKSNLTEILSKKTKMKVKEIQDLDEIYPNQVFIIPSDKGIEVSDEHINLTPRSKNNSAVSIDNLFSTLAYAQKERVIGIVLSGSADDGTLGIKKIKEEGGLTFAQDSSAKFTSMPKSAIETGMVDFILSPKGIASELMRLSQHPLIDSTGSESGNNMFDHAKVEKNSPELKTIIDKLETRKGVDFSIYKLSTIVRRIYRRMLVNKSDSLKDYSDLILTKEAEIDILFKDLLINVTSFFREPETYDYLESHLFPKLLNQKKNNDPLRIWVPACSTGEEAYSIAMILSEVLEKQASNQSIQIFATDLSKSSITKARIGIYTKEELRNVSSKRIKRYFSSSDGNYRVNKEIRAMCVFAYHNILRDPPFSRLDFVSCCNLFIYFDTLAQKKAVNIFHYALNDNGFLKLGKSESISHSINFFGDYSKEQKIYIRKPGTEARRLPELIPSFEHQRLKVGDTVEPNKNQTKSNISVDDKGLETAIDRLLIADFMPPSVVINHQMEIIQFRGNTDLFLSHPKGKATFNILRMARPEIAFELRTAIPKTIRSQEHTRKRGIEMTTGSVINVISLEIIPLEVERDEPLLLILFNKEGQLKTYAQESGEENSSPKDRRIKKLEQELTLAKADALSSIEEQETFTQKLQSAHEEVLSTNEELQTVNEELETSKEELESSNEELTITIQELQSQNELLNESYEFSKAVVNTMHDPLLILSNDLRIKSANDAFYKKFTTAKSETEGELLFNLENKQWDIPALRKLLENTIPKDTQSFNYEVKQTFLDLGERTMSLNARRIIQKSHREHLILLVISDITEVRQLLVEKELRETELLNKELNTRKEEKQKLEKAVEERTQQLKEANMSLEDNNTALENMNAELEAFAYVASHDLQEPLRMVKSYMDQLVRKYGDQLDEKAHKYIYYAADGAERMKRIILDLLQYSRASNPTEEVEEVDINEIVGEFKQLRRRLISEKKATINSDSLPQIITQKAFVRQIFHALLDNALVYTKASVPPVVDISVFKKETEWEFQIKDNGIGIDPKFHDKIFMIFQRLHNKEQFVGTGIGLSIAKKLVEALGGKIWLTSDKDEGSIFCFTFPIKESV